MKTYCLKGSVWTAVALCMLLSLAGTADAQTRYAYLPSVSVSDNRYLSITGAGIQTLGDQVLRFKIASPADAASVGIGVYDGENGGRNDQGTAVLEFTLFADPNADATGTIQLGQWMGNTMPDNAWFDVNVTNVASARGTGGIYHYWLRVRALDYVQMFWSNFKLRATGALSALRLTNIAYSAPCGNAADAQYVYPDYPDLTRTIYDGTWDFFMDVTAPQPSITIWDGDMDRGNFDCTGNDTDDQDTPNMIPPFATGAAVLPEGIAVGGLGCQDANGNQIGGFTTSNPPDNARLPVFRREPSIRYDLIDPNGVAYANDNPSGNLEWEQFRVDTLPFNRNTMDLHANSLPAGLYRIRVQGVDLSNLNSIRTPFDIIGQDSVGVPVPMPLPYYIEGTLTNDANGNGRRDSTEAYLSGWTVTLGGVSVTTDANGHYRFELQAPGSYRVVVTPPPCDNDDGDDDHHNCNDGDRDRGHGNDCDHDDEDNPGRGGGNHGAGKTRHGHDCGGDDDDDDNACWSETFDFDGLATQNAATVGLNADSPNAVLDFGYRNNADDDNGHHRECDGNKSLSFWYGHQNSFPVSSVSLGNKTYNKNEIVNILRNATRSNDKTFQIAGELICAKFNKIRGDNSRGTNDAIYDGDSWLRENPVGSCVNSGHRNWKNEGKGKDRCGKLQDRNEDDCDDNNHHRRRGGDFD